MKPEVIALVVCNLPVYYLYYKILFNDSQSLGDSFRQALRWDVYSFIKGSLLDDWYHTAKLTLWAFLCYKTVYYEYSYFFQQ